MVRSGLVTACLLASCPTRRSPLFLSNATTEGVVLSPSEFVITTGSPPSRTATQLLVVPRSMPMVLATSIPPVLFSYLNRIQYKILVCCVQVLSATTEQKRCAGYVAGLCFQRLRGGEERTHAATHAATA